MHHYKYPIRDSDTACYKLSFVFLANMRHHVCGRRAVLEGDVQPLRRQELDSNVLKFPLLDGHVMHVSKLVLT